MSTVNARQRDAGKNGKAIAVFLQNLKVRRQGVVRTCLIREEELRHDAHIRHHTDEPLRRL